MSRAAKKISLVDQRSTCPIANTLDLLGDKWSLLLLRDMLFLRKTRFSEFSDSNEGISTNILADRLKRLEEYGVLEKTAYQQNPVRHEYRLTARGRDLRPLVFELIRWGNEHIEGTYHPTAEDFSKARRED
jgi:DNA-binding HxlR family transcriptional regulator